MDRVSISQLKDQLSAYLKKVQSGETVLVTDRDRPVAKLEPVDAALMDDARLARLVAAGHVKPATHRLTPDVIQPIDVGADARVVEALLEEREEGR